MYISDFLKHGEIFLSWTHISTGLVCSRKFFTRNTYFLKKHLEYELLSKPWKLCFLLTLFYAISNRLFFFSSGWAGSYSRFQDLTFYTPKTIIGNLKKISKYFNSSNWSWWAIYFFSNHCFGKRHVKYVHSYSVYFNS